MGKVTVNYSFMSTYTDNRVTDDGPTVAALRVRG
jgi:hypothetical protein